MWTQLNSGIRTIGEEGLGRFYPDVYGVPFQGGAGVKSCTLEHAVCFEDDITHFACGPAFSS